MKRVTEFKTVLLIEPIHRYRLFLEGALRDSEFELVAASGPEEVLSLLKGMTPHLILTEDNISGCEVPRFLLQLL